MFGDKRTHIKISENANLDIPDTRICKSCRQYKPTTVTYYDNSNECFDISCENRFLCNYIYTEMVNGLDKKLEEAFNGKLEEEKEG